MDLKDAFPSHEITAALERAPLRETLSLPEETVPFEAIPGYDECQRAHAELVATRRAAELEIFELTGVPIETFAKEGDMGSPHTSWHYDTRHLQDGRSVNLLYKSTLRIKNGQLYGNAGFGYAPVTLRAYIVHPQQRIDEKAMKLQGDLTGCVIYEADSAEMAMGPEVTKLDSFSSIREATITEITAAAYERACMSHVASFMSSIDASGYEASGFNFLGLSSSKGSVDSPAYRLLTAVPQDEEEALKILRRGLHPGSIAALRHVFAHADSAPTVSQAIALHGNGGRMTWLQDHLAVVRADIAEAVRHDVLEGFYPTFNAKLADMSRKVAEIVELAETLGTTRLATECAPKGV